MTDRYWSPGQPANWGRSDALSPACPSIEGFRFAPWCGARTNGRRPYAPPAPKWWSATSSVVGPACCNNPADNVPGELLSSRAAVGQGGQARGGGNESPPPPRPP